MANILTLDDIRAQAEAKFGATEIPLEGGTVCRLVSPVRLSKTKRAELTKVTTSDEDHETTEDEAEQQIVSIITIAAETEKQAEGLLAALRNDDGDIDMALATIVVTSYMKAQQVGEA